ncbi:MAG: glutathione peroxidase [Alphaproteobacteria bacterium]|nr:glutathione peroxidase [Alphaproteobacteria bacterium]
MELITYLIIFILIVFFIQKKHLSRIEDKTAYNFSFKELVGGDMIRLKQFKGKVLLIVNTASECGFTPQYEGIETLYNKYKHKGFVVIGIPSNDFGGQEPGSKKEIADFCKINYGVTFPMTSKEIVSGNKAHPFYIWAKKILGFGTSPKWNFHKYLVDRHGNLVDYFNSTTFPDSKRLTNAIERALAEQ